MKHAIQRKKTFQKAVRVNITLSPILLEKSGEIIRRQGFSGLSDYVQSKIRRDAGLETAA